MKKAFQKLLLITVTLLVVFNMQRVLAQVTPQLIGMSQYDGAFNEGTIFKINTDGTGLATLHDFNGAEGGIGVGSLIQASNGLLYGMTSNRGLYGIGTIFQMKPDGTGYTVLHNFDNATGRYTNGSLIQGADGALYGMAYSGGFLGFGTIFRIELNGLGFKVLHHFNSVNGGLPEASLIQLPDGKLYGIALAQNAGIFRINTDGTGYEVIFDLNNYRGAGSLIHGQDGALYGTAMRAFGTNPAIYKVNPDGSEFTIVQYFWWEIGERPQTNVTQAPDGHLFQLSYEGGMYNRGTIVRVNPDGSEPGVLHHFNGPDGAHPVGQVTYYNDLIFGFTSQGGLNGGGVIFKYDPANGTYTKMADLNKSTGTYPWRGQLLLVTPPSTIETPTEPVNTVTFSNVFSTSMKVSFHPGNGSKHLAVMKAGSQPAFVPTDDTSYTGDLGNGESVVYNGTESSFNITSLLPDTEYFITIFEYNQDSTSTRYLTTNAPVSSRHTQSTIGQFVGVTPNEGASNAGTIYKFDPNTNQVDLLYSFKSPMGRSPFSGLIQGADEWLYGTTLTGVGFAKYGGIFKISPDGTNYTPLYSLKPEDGIYPRGSLLQTADGSLYGIGESGGISGYGTLFKINPDGSGFTVVYRFTNGADGRGPHGSLIQATDGYLYGITGAGGITQLGTIFRIKPDGNDFTVIHNFATAYEMNHRGSLIQGSDGLLYGTTSGAGSANPGSVFKLNLDGSGYTTLHNFTSIKDGAPWGTLVQVPDGSLYGTTMGDATNTSPNGYGTIFKMNPDGSAYAAVHYFDGLNGSLPKGDLTYYENKLFGYTHSGGQYGGGVIFNYDLATAAYHKLADLNDATGTHPWHGKLLFINAPAGESNFVVKPGDNAGAMPLNINVIANEVPGAETYTIELNTDPAFGANTAIVKTGGKVIPFSNLSMGTIYYNRVRTNVTPYWGPSKKFTTGDALSLAYVISPFNNSNFISWEPIIKVNPIQGVSTYTVQLSTDRWFQEPAIEMSSDSTAIQFTGLEQNTTYYSRVMTDLNPNSWGPTRAFTTGNVISAAFVVNPRDQATAVSPTKNFIANIVPSATQYTIQLSEQADFSSIAFENTGPTNTLPFTGLKYNTTYYDRVRTNLSSEFGAIRSFTTLSPEALAYVTSPANRSANIKVNKLNITSKEVPGASSYTIQLSELADFTVIAFESTGPTRTLAFNGLLYNTTYYTRVLTDLTDLYGEVRSFTTVANPMVSIQSMPDDGELKEFQVSAYPNPFTEQFTLRVESDLQDIARVALINVTGQKVFESIVKTNTDIEISRPIVAGAYFLRVNAGASVKVIKIIKTH